MSLLILILLWVHCASWMCVDQWFYQIWKVLSHCFSKIICPFFSSYLIKCMLVYLMLSNRFLRFCDLNLLSVSYRYDNFHRFTVDFAVFFPSWIFCWDPLVSFLCQFLHFSTPKFPLGFFFIISIFLWNTLFISLLSHFP